MAWPTRRPTASTCPWTASRATASSPTNPSSRCGRAPGSRRWRRSGRPLDFVLWKKAKPGEPTWESPWGPGRPGWHTECVVMSLDLLGDGFDVHGGAIDLIFPHHENERAQAVALGRDFARHWVHNGWVTVDGEKMSKSLGNFTSLDDLVARSDPRAYRLLVLRSHYRSPIEVTPDDGGRRRGRTEPPGRAGPPVPTGRQPWHRDRWSTGRGWPAGADAGASPGSATGWTTISTPPAPWPAFSTSPWCAGPIGRPTVGEDETAARLAVDGRRPLWSLGLAHARAGADDEVDAETATMVAERDAARAARDWARADELRDQLVALGWVVEDRPPARGSGDADREVWRWGAGFGPESGFGGGERGWPAGFRPGGGEHSVNSPGIVGGSRRGC